MNILAIETSTEVCGIAYFKNDEMVGIEEAKIPRKHAASLPSFYTSLQDKTNFVLNELDGIAVSIGPGSFTGLRIGLSFAKGLAYSHDLPIIPVPTLQAIALNRNHETPFHVLLFSHRDMIYHQSFSTVGHPILEPEVKKWDDLESVVGNETFFHVNCDTFTKSNTHAINVHATAENIGELALNNFNDWVVKKPYTLVPNYIAPFEMNKLK